MSLSTLRRHRFLILSVLLIWIGFATRLHHLGGDSLWMDEMITADVVQNGQIFSVRDHPPLLYLLVTGTTHLFDGSEFSLRLPSALAAVLAIPLLIRFGTALRYPTVGMWAALLLNLLPFHLRYAQEARHYALLLTFSLATYLLLWLALRQQKTIYFVSYGVLTAINLYTHYGALTVLASQTVLIAGWLVFCIIKKQYRAVLHITLSVGVLLLLYAFQLPHLYAAVTNHSGENAVAGSGFVSLSVWLREILFAFSFNSHGLIYLTAGVCLIGFIILAVKKQWMALAFMMTGLILPLIFIQLLHVSRWAFPKYVIYMLPFYILGIAITIDEGIRRLAQKMVRNRHNGYAYVAIPASILLFFALLPLLRAEYAYVERDWRSVADALEEKGADDGVVLTVTMDMDGFNQVSGSLSYYLNQKSSDYTVLATNYLDPDMVQDLIGADVTVWTVLFNRVVPIVFDESSTLSVEPYQGSLYLVEKPDQTDGTLAEVINIYEQLIPLVATPAQQCLIKRDAALLSIAQQDFLSAKRWFEEAHTQCPAKIPFEYAEQDFRQSIYPPLIEQYEAQGQHDEALRIATTLFHMDSKNTAALDTLLIFDVLAAFRDGELSVSDEQAVMPVQTRPFAIPPYSEARETLLTHVPASVSFQVQLPEEPTLFYSRVAMHPDSWAWGGDGADFIVRIQPEDAPSTEIYRLYVSNDQNDQKWHEINIPLQSYAGQQVTMTLTAEPGPNWDFSGDWAGWESPLILRDVP